MTAQVLLHNTLLPRIAVALMTGATLGLVGAILQNILRNPLAEPATLGISAGSYLLLAIATLWFPQWMAAQEWIAFAGAALSLLAILALSWRKGLSPVTVTLAGMIVRGRRSSTTARMSTARRGARKATALQSC
ncbi:iron chelate uptake ABC transporter family permease subunit [Agrobacterium tumefaciens]|uniref:iron chelate uptake ABC transporter family permease subunit n=1 Tax=Agrobacterium tumefaciens TaxID=358 RepID=UPI001EEE4FB9|nr:iron chelate uptake ABC transporter family permease subunit [Agrobacterium tumefaciens]